MNKLKKIIFFVGLIQVLNISSANRDLASLIEQGKTTFLNDYESLKIKGLKKNTVTEASKLYFVNKETSKNKVFNEVISYIKNKTYPKDNEFIGFEIHDNYLMPKEKFLKKYPKMQKYSDYFYMSSIFSGFHVDTKFDSSKTYVFLARDKETYRKVFDLNSINTEKRNLQLLKRLEFYQVKSMIKSENGQKWYEIDKNLWIKNDDDLREFRALSSEELKPFKNKKLIHINLQEQILSLYNEQGVLEYFTLTSTGKERFATSKGVFPIIEKMTHKTMFGGKAADSYHIENIPWNIRFYKGLYIHGTYWHDYYGIKSSHGCVNLSNTDAKHVHDWIGDSTYYKYKVKVFVE